MTGALLTVLPSVIATGATLLQLLEDMRSAPIDISEIKREMSQLCPIIERLRVSQTDSRSTSAASLGQVCLRISATQVGDQHLWKENETNLAALLYSCRVIFWQTTKLLERYSGDSEKRIFAKHVDRIMWMLEGQRKADKLMRRLETNKSTLSIAVGLITQSTVERAGHRLEELYENTQLILAQIGTVMGRLDQEEASSALVKGSSENSLLIRRYLESASSYAESIISGSISTCEYYPRSRGYAVKYSHQPKKEQPEDEDWESDDEQPEEQQSDEKGFEDDQPDKYQYADSEGICYSAGKTGKLSQYAESICESVVTSESTSDATAESKSNEGGSANLYTVAPNTRESPVAAEEATGNMDSTISQTNETESNSKLERITLFNQEAPYRVVDPLRKHGIYRERSPLQSIIRWHRDMQEGPHFESDSDYESPGDGPSCESPPRAVRSSHNFMQIRQQFEADPDCKRSEDGAICESPPLQSVMRRHRDMQEKLEVEFDIDLDCESAGDSDGAIREPPESPQPVSRWYKDMQIEEDQLEPESDPHCNILRGVAIHESPLESVESWDGDKKELVEPEVNMINRESSRAGHGAGRYLSLQAVKSRDCGMQRRPESVTDPASKGPGDGPIHELPLRRAVKSCQWDDDVQEVQSSKPDHDKSLGHSTSPKSLLDCFIPKPTILTAEEVIRLGTVSVLDCFIPSSTPLLSLEEIDQLTSSL
ncbi:hypothetical protein BJ508DRAFT_326308 [Ascobolus immersus RN42]|uniref:Fungal N-terminal domain-containing protein n=1 Tax=Ascobolus immersus RN42 TaxID=1160509 RepID=A0A3N4I6A9_ASCIM|nr:hypothetical protein BJ508DRAFT_326308 [Ascobolus immersus RN42]